MAESASLVMTGPASHEPLIDNESRLFRLKTGATGLLVLMALLFAGAKLFEARYPALSWLRAFSEAAMVGGLADWFAVTALFRHPLGIPIPHTAIIPRKKDSLGHTLGSFIQQNFLTEDALAEKALQFGPAKRLLEYLSDEARRERLAAEVTRLLPAAVRAAGEEEVSQLLTHMMRDVTKDVNLANVAAHILEIMRQDNTHQELVTDILRLLEDALSRNELTVRDTVRPEMPWWVPAFIANLVSDATVSRLRGLVSQVDADPSHRFRERVDAAVLYFIEQLRTSEAYQQKGEAIKTWVLESEHLRLYLRNLARELERFITKDCEDADAASRINGLLLRLLATLTNELKFHRRLQRRINRTVENFVREAVKQRRSSIVALISDTVRRWDSETVVNKVELVVGRDLQYIRLNGTLVGGLAGLLIHLLGSHVLLP